MALPLIMCNAGIEIPLVVLGVTRLQLENRKRSKTHFYESSFRPRMMQKGHILAMNPPESSPDQAEPTIFVPSEDAALPANASEKKSWHFVFELLPLAAFFVAYRAMDIWSATAVLMGVTFACVAMQWLLTRKVPVLTLLTGGMVGLFGLLTLALHDPQFIKMKPTLIYSLFALILAGGRLMGKNPLAKVFGQVFPLTPRGWQVLTWRWVIFFALLALGNEILWRHVSEAVWVDCKVFGFLPLTLLFGACQTPLLMRESVKND